MTHKGIIDEVGNKSLKADIKCELYFIFVNALKLQHDNGENFAALTSSCHTSTYGTRSSATAEKQRVSCAHIPTCRLAMLTC